tara:strand:+ start:80 stop:301 length:222 start_codon:yes stop_codon:yes gene_type:complete
MNNKWSDFLVYNKGFLRWNYPKGDLIIFSDETNKSDKQLIDERCELQKDDKIIWVDDLKGKIKKEYLKQIKND